MNDQGPKLTIWMDAAGRVQVTGPISNKGLCYMLLEVAKDAIREHVAKHQSPILVPPIAMPPDVAGNGS